MHAADPNAFADAVYQRPCTETATGHHIWLVWQPMYQTYGVKCETIATDLLNASTKGGGGGRNYRHQSPGAVLRTDEPHRVRTVGTLTGGPVTPPTAPTAPTGPRRATTSPDPPGPDARGRGAAALAAAARVPARGPAPVRRGPGRRRWARSAWPTSSSTAPTPRPPAWRPGCTRGCWAGTPAGTRRSPAWATARSGASPCASSRPCRSLTHALAWVPGLGDGPALVLLANAAALAATAMLYVLVRRETGDAARGPARALDPQPAARRLRPRHGLRRVACCWCWPSGASSPCGRRRASAPPARTSPSPACSPSAAALTRPIGVLLVLAVVAEVVRWWPRLGRGERVAGLGAVAAPFVGLLAFLAWSKHTVGDWLAPLRVQLQSSHHGGPLRPLRHAVPRRHGRAAPPRRARPSTSRGCCSPWPCSSSAGAASRPPTRSSPPRSWPSRWPAPTSIRSSATPSAPSRCRSPPRSSSPETQLERAVLALLAAGLAGYALLAFLNISVP